jgi:hypothetical protein
MSVVEVLVSLAITAMLLTAAAAAFNASARAVELNDQFFRASQSARVSVNQIVTEIRRCQAADVDEAAVTLELTTAAGENRIYSYDAAQQILTMTVALPDGARVHTLARNVTSLNFFTDEATIVVNITITVGSNAITLNGSALPRRSVTFD